VGFSQIPIRLSLHDTKVMVIAKSGFNRAWWRSKQ